MGKKQKKRKKIMHVDDNLEHLNLVKTVLEGEGYEVVQVISGADCLKKFKKEKPDLVLLDILMPEMDGLEVFKEIKKIDSKAAVAFLTVVRGSEEEVNRLKRAGIVEYIQKPFTPSDLISRVKKILKP
jgi:two-component system alkaline phosphatase synthesis response regulator PhoP